VIGWIKDLVISSDAQTRGSMCAFGTSSRLFRSGFCDLDRYTGASSTGDFLHLQGVLQLPGK
jgi:hypothetical protein